MPITPATNETLDLKLVDPPAAARCFGGGGCVFEREGLSHAFVRGTLVGETAWEVAERRVSTDALRIAMDAVVMALGVGQKCVEGVRRLATSTAAALMMATSMPSPTWTRRTLGCFAMKEGGMRLHLGTAGKHLREAQASSSNAGPVFYVDNQRPYTGQEVIRRGWRMQDKRVRPGTSDYYVHDEDGRPVMRIASASHASLTEWLLPIAYLLRRALGDKETILLAFDRAGAFPKQMATLREGGVEFVTYERRPYPIRNSRTRPSPTKWRWTTRHCASATPERTSARDVAASAASR